MHPSPVRGSRSLVWLLVAGLLGGVGCASAGGSGSGQRRTSGYEVRAATTETRDGSGGMAVQAEEGSLDQDDAEDAIRRHWGKLVRCYDEAGPARDFAGGGVTLRFEVARDGRTSAVHVLESKLGSLEVERCLMQASRAIRFPRPHGNARAFFEYSLEFRSTGEVPVIDLPADATAAALPAVLTRLSLDCHELGVEEVTVTLYIDRQGEVRSLGLASRTPVPEETAACIARTLKATQIPVEVEGTAVGRTLVALRNQDVLNPPPLSRPAKRQPSRLARRK
jgi:hypothetical protein